MSYRLEHINLKFSYGIRMQVSKRKPLQTILGYVQLIEMKYFQNFLNS